MSIKSVRRRHVLGSLEIPAFHGPSDGKITTVPWLCNCIVHDTDPLVIAKARNKLEYFEQETTLKFAGF